MCACTSAVHNSAVLLCRLRCISSADLVVLRPEELNKKSEVGNFLLSQEAALQVPSADTRLTAGFGMFPGIPTLLSSPTSLLYFPNTIYIPFFPGPPSKKTSLFLTPRKSLRSLVPVCSIHYCTFTSGLSSK